MKRLFEHTDTKTAESIITIALKHIAPEALLSISTPAARPAAAAAPGWLNIEKAVISGRIISGFAFFMLISIISV